ncbi:MAG: mechanosensitive ion channel family protein [Myxococcales bacterium]|nr:mechanosensitive ion channel family protein [Myxococcales bacterium]
MSGTLAVFAAVLLLLLLVLLPRARWSSLRRPLGAFAVYAGLFALAQVFGEHREEANWIRVAAFAAILVVVSRTSVLLATETAFGRWLLPPIPRIIADVLQGLILAVVALATLAAAGFEPGQLLTTSALLTAVVGLALQDTLGNLFAGLSLQLDRQFDVGDWIDIDADPLKNGRVVEVSWRTTKVLTLDRVEIIVPNGVIAKSPVRIYTRPDPAQRRIIAFGCPYTVPPGRVKQVVEAAMADLPGVLHEPHPEVLTRGFGDNAVLYELRYHTDDHERAHHTDAAVVDRIWHALARAEIPIPYPQRDVHVFQRDAEQRRIDVQEGIERRVRALERVPLLSVLEDEILRELASESGERTYAAAERIVREGDEGSELFVVVAGDVVVSAGQPEREVATLGAGGFFGEMSLLTGERRNATVRAVKETRLVVVGHEGLRRLLRRHPELYERLSAVLAERQMQLEAATEQLLDEPTQREVQERSGMLLRRIQAFFRG